MRARRENELGLTRCKYCGSGKASVRLSAKGLAYVMCDNCNLQTLARSDVSDELLRASITDPVASDPAPDQSEPPREGDKAQPAIQHALPEQPAKRPGWGFAG